MPLATAYLALGSNLGQRLDQMRSALRLLEAGGVRVRAASHVYQNRAIGMDDADPFLNAVVQVETTLEPELLLDLCLKVETQLGRVRTAGWSPRTIDIDVLVYGEAHVETERLQVPHPRIAERDFVLQPLVDIQPDLQLFGRTVREHLVALRVVELERVSEVLNESN